ncbi:aromatic-ring-hydroxylating dioxygenase subunit beta [Nocardioides zeae]|uniref:Aromatic-ring-hydroxylating dioxygenase subunit beta n=1 Tax=Nocardioides zeae TaxID=1457234 RepID=A0A6P0HLY9_9ACTN|nr:aromatic-ring-hydroxylating dioxygenase subunit beta [Nocardioides zeae]NEN79729.1 aromatic-ring-hydroxylating dioxygenase subunit beta [Nocardioides zeae]
MTLTASNPDVVGPRASLETHHEVEQFLFDEGELLDQWRLHEWLELFSTDAHYEVPTTDLPDGDPSKDLFLVHDDRFLLEQRVNSLLTRAAHAEYPHSVTRRLITNVQVREGAERQLHVRANFAVHRFRSGVADTYVGQYRHVIERDVDGGFVYLRRRCVLANDVLRPHGKVSILL